MPKISVIMPVYNDAKYLEEAIDSIINQTLDDVEIVCVNDGSTDNSLDILRELESDFDFIKVFSQENKGVAHARNFAMENCTGEYLAFLDADDIFIDKDCLEKLYMVAKDNEANMVSGNIKLWNGEGSFSDFTHLEYYTEEKMILPWDYGIPFSFTKAIFKRKFLSDNNIMFPILTKGEDPVFLAEILSKLDKLYAVPTDVYAYRFFSGASAAQKYTNYGNYLDQITQYHLVFKHLSDPKFDKYRQEFRGQLIGFIDMMGINGAKDTLKAIREVFAEDKETLRDCEDYFHFKYENNEELKDLAKLTKNPEKPRISVVIPIFKDYDELNLDCLHNQTFDDFDVNVFTDKPAGELEKIIGLGNDGISVYGTDEKSYLNDVLEKIKGEFVFFCNPEDDINEKHLKELYKNIIANGSDLVLNELNEISYEKYPNLFNFKEIFKVNFNRFNFNHEEAKNQVLNSFFTPNMALYKKSFLKEHFDEFNGIGSNEFFMLFNLINAKFISFCPFTSYDYSFDDIENNFTDFKELDEKFDSIKEFLIENGHFSEFEGIFDDYKVDFGFKHLNVLKSEEFFNGFRDYILNGSEISPETLDINDKNFNLFLDSQSFQEYDLKIKLNELAAEKDELLNENEKLIADVDKLKKKKNEIINSKSWKITKPLRFIRNFRF